MQDTKIDVLNYLTSSRELLVAALVVKYGNECFMCHKPFSDVIEITIDHWMPQAFGKMNGWTSDEIHGIDNLRPMCKFCNANKGDRVPNEDGTLPPKNTRDPKMPRPETCDVCVNGRLLLAGEICDYCGSVPQPIAFPRYSFQQDPRKCSHGWERDDHCRLCGMGVYQRKPAAIDVFGNRP